jgi:nitroreductase
MMINDDVYETAVGAIELAARAPSIHNSQPWQCLLTDETLQLYAARDRWLPATDADRRDLMLSCGAMLHHLVVALRATGLEPRVHRLPNEAVENHVAAIELRDGSASDADIDLARAISARRTDRRPFTTWEIPETFLQQLVQRAADQGAVLRVIADPAGRNALLAAIRDSATAQRQVPGYETELALWTGRSFSDEGVPAASLLREPSPHAEARRDFPKGDSAQGSTSPTAQCCWCSAPPPTIGCPSCGRAKR